MVEPFKVTVHAFTFLGHRLNCVMNAHIPRVRFPLGDVWSSILVIIVRLSDRAPVGNTEASRHQRYTIWVEARKETVIKGNILFLVRVLVRVFSTRYSFCGKSDRTGLALRSWCHGLNGGQVSGPARSRVR